MKKIFVFGAVVMLPLMVQAQSGATGGTTSSQSNPTVEDIYLRTTVEVQVIRSLVQNPSRDQKMKALDYIANMVEEGKAGPDNIQIIQLLDELGSEGTSRRVYEDGRLANDFPEVRRRAAELLGLVGGPRARDALIDIANRERETMVSAEAIYALGQVEPDEAGLVDTVIAEVIRRQDAVRPDNNLAFAAIMALENLGKARRGQVKPEVFTALVQISQGNYIRAVRNRAVKLLDDFRKYN
jgi:HEAT repeat protein